MDRLRHFALLIAALGLVTALATACDSGTQEPAAPDGPATSAAIDDSGERPPDEIPESRYPTELPEDAVAAIPEIFPEEVPLYPGAVPALGRGKEVDGVPMSAVQLMTLDAPEEVVGYYSDKLEDEGWTIENPGDNANAIAASRGDCKASMLVVPTEDGGSNIYIFTEC